ncbi:MAG: BamA/TamA family outer membrane protein [Pseudomonadota bacterium]
MVGARSAHAVGERITDVRVMGNIRTGEDTIRSLAGVSIGDTLEADTLASVRERLNTVGLFADVNVWWENRPEGVRINIAVKDKFPWAPVPTGSWSANNKAIGLLFVHGNLFGRGKQMAIGGKLATLDSGGLLAYRDPAFFGTWIYWELKGMAQRQIIPEYDGINTRQPPISPWRQTTVDAFGIEPAVGVAWFRRVKTQVSWRLDKVKYKGTKLFDPGTGVEVPFDPAVDPVSTLGGTVGIGRAAVAFDWRAREHAVMMGPALGGSLDYASSVFGSDSIYKFWRATAFWEQGFRVFRRHNFVYSLGGFVGNKTPLFWDTTAGGTSLRGYLVQQFRGDTQAAAHVEYHFPLFSIASLDFRGLAFYDASAIWFRKLAEGTSGYVVRPEDGRSFNLNYLAPGFDFKRDVHNTVGAGLRFFLRSVAVPLVGIDAGYGLEAKSWRFILIVGA